MDAQAGSPCQVDFSQAGAVTEGEVFIETGKVSVRKGAAGSPAAFSRLACGLSAQA